MNTSGIVNINVEYNLKGMKYNILFVTFPLQRWLDVFRFEC